MQPFPTAFLIYWGLILYNCLILHISIFFIENLHFQYKDRASKWKI